MKAGWLLLLLGLVLAGCLAEPQLKTVKLSDIEAERPRTATSPADGRVLRLAVAPVWSPRESLNIYQDFALYLGRRLGRPAELVQGKTYAEINDLVRSGDLALAIVCTNAYLEGQEDFGMEALAVPQVHGETVYYSYLLVPQDSPAQSLTDLKGRTFAFSDPLSNSGRLVVVYQLQQLGYTPESFFQRYIFTYSHDNSIQAVQKHLVDGAAVDSLVYDFMATRNPELAAATRIIARWGPYGINPVVVHPRLDPALKAQLQGLLLTLHEVPEGAAILQGMGIDRFVLPDERLYDSVRVMRTQVRRLQR